MTIHVSTYIYICMSAHTCLMSARMSTHMSINTNLEASSDLGARLFLVGRKARRLLRQRSQVLGTALLCQRSRHRPTYTSRHDCTKTSYTNIAFASNLVYTRAASVIWRVFVVRHEERREPSVHDSKLHLAEYRALEFAHWSPTDKILPVSRLCDCLLNGSFCLYMPCLSVQG